MLPLLLTACHSKSKQEEIPVTQVRHGDFYIDLYEEGDVQATESKLIKSPEISWRYGNLKIATLIEDGTEVEEGDTVMTFDPTDVRKAIMDSEQQLELQYAEKEKLLAQQRSSLEGMISDFEVSKISLEISRLNLESAQYEAEITRKEIELNLQQAELSLEQAENQIENTRRLQHEERMQKDLRIHQCEQELEDAKNTLDQLYVVAPSPGIVILRKNYSTNAVYQEGEQVWSGQAIMELPNLRELKTNLKINEVDISKVREGLEVEIRPDAFTDSIYHGKVVTVANLAVNKNNSSRIKVFPVEVLITSPINRSFEQMPELMPGMTVSCRILVDKIPDVSYIPLNALFRKDEKDVVYLQTASGWRAQEVVLGERNTDYVIVTEGLKTGETIALINPEALEEAEKEASEKGGRK